MNEKLYIGTKIIAAEEMGEAAFLAQFKPEEYARLGFTPPEGREGYKVRYEDGYISWSPKDVFEHAYREISKAELAMVDQVDGVPL